MTLALSAVVATLSAPVSAAGHKQSRTAAILPAADLGDEVVAVAWAGFRPTQADGTYGVTILQCRAHPRSVARDCNTDETFPFSLTGNQQLGVTHKDGTGRVFMDVMTTARLPSLACSETHPCSLLLYENTADGFDPNGLPKDRATVPLHFAKSFGDCPPVRSFDVRIETESSAAPALYQWAADFCTGKNAFTIDVTNTSSNSARESYFSKQVDIAVSSLPPIPGQITPTSPTFSVTPIDLTAVAIAYNIVDPVSHKQVTDLTLTPRLVARLVSDSDLESFFHDPELRKLNPHHHWPIQAAAPGLRGEQNADTWIVTNWLNGNGAARRFLDGKDRYHVPVNSAWLRVKYPTDVFPARLPDGVYFPRQGEEGVAERLFSGTKPAESVPSDPLNAGFIGVLDFPTAQRFKLPVAKLTNGAGQPVVTLDATSLARGYQAMKTSPAGFHFEPAVVSDAHAYPLAKVDHAIVPKVLTHSDRDLRIRAMLDYAVSYGQLALPPGYAAMPKSLALQTLRYTGDLPASPTTTTTTTLPYSPPTYSGGGSDYVGANGHPITNETTPTTPTTPTTSAPRGTTTTSTTKPRQARLVVLKLPDSGDRLVLPIVLLLASLSLLATSADFVRRRGRKLLRR